MLSLAWVNADAGSMRPGPELSPAEAVKLQLQALKHNDLPQRDSGIALVFQFASPGNRAHVGPLPRFAQMIHRSYSEMLDYQTAVFEPVVTRGDRAAQPVDLIDRDGEAHRYVFVLRRQKTSPCQDCWLTDSVLSDPQRPSLAL